MSYKIDKGIPLTPIAHRKSKQLKYPLHKLEVGDSFFVPGKKADEVFTYYYTSSHPDYLIKKRSVKENGRYGTRIWRVRKDID